MKRLTGADALLLITEWREFRVPNWDRVKQSIEGHRWSLTAAIYTAGQNCVPPGSPITVELD